MVAMRTANPRLASAVVERDLLLRGHHAMDLSRRQQEVLALESFGFDCAEIARLLGIGETTVYTHAHEAHQRAVPPGLTPTRENAIAWAPRHRTCCLATAFAQLGLRISMR